MLKSSNAELASQILPTQALYQGDQDKVDETSLMKFKMLLQAKESIQII